MSFKDRWCVFLYRVRERYPNAVVDIQPNQGRITVEKAIAIFYFTTGTIQIQGGYGPAADFFAELREEMKKGPLISSVFKK